MNTRQHTIVRALLPVIVLIAAASCKSGRNMSASKSRQPELTYAAPPANAMEKTVIKYSENGEFGKKLYIRMGEYAAMLHENLKDVAEVRQIGEGVIVTMKKGDYFDVNSFMLKKNREHDFLKVVHSLKLMPDTYVQVSGHTDNTGPGQYNEKLSVRRAQQVANFLHQFGVSEDQLFFEGYGETIPGFSNQSISGRNRNRRVDFVIIPSNGMREAVASTMY